VREESAGLNAPPCHPSRVFLNSKQGHTSANEKIPTRKDAKDNEIICHDGGWDNWKVVKNADYTSGSYDDALKRERCWIEEI
jgi:hypothetical protein